MSENKEATPAKPAAPAADSWTKWVALTTTILAVGAAFSTMKGGGFSTQTQLNTVKATNNWSYFQSKSIKQTARETERSILLAMQAGAQEVPETRVPVGNKGAFSIEQPSAKELAYIKTELEVCDQKLTQYKEEMPKIKADAEKCERKAEWTQYRGGKFGLAAMFLQVGIMLCAISALLKKKGSWIVGMCIGIAGLAYLAYGWFSLPDNPPKEWKSPSQLSTEAAAKTAILSQK